MVDLPQIGTTQVTFLVDPSGVVQAVWPRVKVDGSAEKVPAGLKELAGATGR